jgi:hypothetical protein
MEAHRLHGNRDAHHNCHTNTISHHHTITLPRSQDTTVQHCHIYSLSNYYTITLPHYHIATQSHFQTITLHHYHTATLSHCHTNTLPHNHTITLPCYYKCTQSGTTHPSIWVPHLSTVIWASIPKRTEYFATKNRTDPIAHHTTEQNSLTP